jgi:hypothetical protein
MIITCLNIMDCYDNDLRAKLALIKSGLQSSKAASLSQTPSLLSRLTSQSFRGPKKGSITILHEEAPLQSSLLRARKQSQK